MEVVKGVYVVVACLRLRSYNLIDAQGKELPHPWKAKHLKEIFCLESSKRLLIHTFCVQTPQANKGGNN